MVLTKLGKAPADFSAHTEPLFLWHEKTSGQGEFEVLPHLISHASISKGAMDELPTAEIILNLARPPGYVGATPVRDWQIVDAYGVVGNVTDAILNGRRIQLRTARHRHRRTGCCSTATSNAWSWAGPAWASSSAGRGFTPSR